jgi:hypothetical protein
LAFRKNMINIVLLPKNIFVNNKELKNEKDDDGDGYVDNFGFCEITPFTEIQ